MDGIGPLPFASFPIPLPLASFPIHSSPIQLQPLPGTPRTGRDRNLSKKKMLQGMKGTTNHTKFQENEGERGQRRSL